MSLSIKDLTKVYNNGVKALDHLSLDISTGMFGLLGPNGAGKSSLMRTLATLQTADSGSIQFNEINVLNDQMALRRILGYLPQFFGVYKKETAENLLNYLAILKGISDKKQRQNLVSYALDITNLTDVRKVHVSSYSGGMKQRFGIAQLLLNNPSLIIVDEPTAGLDPAERNHFLNILREISATNTVIFSTHIVDDIKYLCTDMAIMNKGKTLLHDTPTRAIERLLNKVWSIKIEPELLENYASKYQILSSSYSEDNDLILRIYSREPMGDIYRKEHPTLEDLYFAVLNDYERLTESISS